MPRMDSEISVFSFAGRRDRLSYLLWLLIFALAGAVVYSYVRPFLATQVKATTVVDLRLIAAGLAALPFAWQILSLTAQRLHDIGLTGWWQALVLLLVWITPWAGLLYLIPLLLAGRPGGNDYGPPPYSQ